MNSLHILDRKTAPLSNKIENLAIQQAEKHLLQNGIPVFTIHSGTQEVLRIEFIFEAGEIGQTSPLLARTVNGLLQDGTKNKTGLELANQLDFYGAFLEADTGKDLASLTLYVAKKHLKNVLPMVVEILTEASLPEEEFLLRMKNGKQNHKINLEKTEFLASKHFGEAAFKNTAYQSNLKIEHYDTLTLPEVHSFYKQKYALQNLTIVASGMADKEVLNILNDSFSMSVRALNNKTDAPPFEYDYRSEKNIVHIEKQNAMQSSIRIGRKMFLNDHPDKYKFSILNCILGGYFGSRLMANIREDKGYTYGISSGYSAFRQAGVFTIGTDVGAEVTEKAILEIFKEIEILKSVPVPTDELELVKSYLLGSLLKGLDGPFSLADRFKSVYFYGLTYASYDKYIETINNIKSIDIQEMANKYLNEDSLLQVIVGSKQLK